MSILLKELSAYYNAYFQYQIPAITPLPMQYVDYALWQRHYLQGEVLQKQLSYWQAQLKDIQDVLNLPIDKVRPSVMSQQGKQYRVTLAKDLFEEVKDLSQQQGVTLFMTLLAAFKVLLYRYSGQTDMIVGTPIANRPFQETEKLIGFFLNTLALRSALNPMQSFTTLLEQVKQTTLAAFEHQDVPFDQLIEQLKIDRDLSRHPLFQVMLTLQNNEQAQLQLKDITAGPGGSGRRTWSARCRRYEAPG